MLDATFIKTWHEAVRTTTGLFWMAFWAFALGYLISSMIQVFVTRERMRKSMGRAGVKSVLLGTFFGFLSSSCSFAALSATRSLFTKGAGIVPSLAFLLASTNLVIELGIVIAVFLSWQFVVGEYLGGLMLILLTWLVVRITRPRKIVQEARENARSLDDGDAEEKIPDWRSLILSREGWRRVAHRYVMEWAMVWKDVTVGFTVAGIIAAFVPERFFQALFLGAGSKDPSFWEILWQTFIGPVAAFFTFIGSMGNIPLAAVLFGNGVSFAGIIAFIFSDLVVFPVLRIQAKYYGWKMALYILAVFLAVLIASAIILHYGFAALGALPDSGTAGDISKREFFAVDYTFFINVGFCVLSLVFVIWRTKDTGIGIAIGDALSEKILFGFVILAALWLVGGWIVPLASGSLQAGAG
ncbi:MAG: permease [Rhodospirillales bacterium]